MKFKFSRNRPMPDECITQRWINYLLLLRARIINKSIDAMKCLEVKNTLRTAPIKARLEKHLDN